MLSLLKRIAAAGSQVEAVGKSTLSGGLQPPVDLASGPYQIISDAGRIERILLDLSRDKAPVMLNARGQSRLSPVRLKGVDREARLILVTQLWNDAEHAALMNDRHLNLSAHHGGLPVFFTVDVQDTTAVGGAPCYRMPFPTWILAMEMRDSIRIRLPEELRACLQCSLPPDLQLEARVVDISEGGICFVLPTALASGISTGSAALPALFRTQQEEIGTLSMRPRRMERHGDITHVGATIQLDSELGRQGLRRLIMAYQRNLLRL